MHSVLNLIEGGTRRTGWHNMNRIGYNETKSDSSQSMETIDFADDKAS